MTTKENSLCDDSLFFFWLQTGKPSQPATTGNHRQTSKPANQASQSAKEEESAQKKSEESRCVCVNINIIIFIQR